MRLPPGRALRVSLGDRRAGRLAWRDRRAFFEHDEAFLATGIALSPFRLPPQPGVIEAPLTPFGGLFGVFDDSLPDGWGRLLQDRLAASSGVDPATLTPLDRLAWVGSNGLGALVYEPELGPGEVGGDAELDALAAASERVLRGAADDVLPELVRLGGSPQGARPKVVVWLDPADHHVATSPAPGHRAVIVKFQAKADGPDAGAVEHAYHALARAAGLDVPEAWLVESRSSAGWFAVERFDREASGARIHAHTLAGLLHADHRAPSVDYVGALAATHRLTGDHRAVEQHLRRMVFNVVAHNRDDHARQVTYLLRDRSWTLSPAYDLTCSDGPGGEHAMALAGRGDPDLDAALDVARRVGVPEGRARAIALEVSAAVLDTWPQVAPTEAARARVEKRLRPLR